LTAGLLDHLVEEVLIHALGFEPHRTLGHADQSPGVLVRLPFDEAILRNLGVVGT